MVPLEIRIHRIRSADAIDLGPINHHWEHVADAADYDPAAFSAYVADDSNLMLMALHGAKMVGALLATIVKKPYKDGDFLYVDEVDTHPDWRRRRIGTRLMEAAVRFARDRDLDEVWLGTEPGNLAANALYNSLSNVVREDVVGYTFELVD